MNRDYLNELNPAQRAAVEYCDGPELVIAGAGSGKTRVLTYKIMHLLSQGIEPWRILALTFTNKAADEMRERIEKQVGNPTAKHLWMGTFHSVFARILRQHADKLGFKSSFTIYDTGDSKSLIKSIIKNMNLDDKVYKPSTVLNSISRAKNALVSPAMYKASDSIMKADARADRPYTWQIYAAYMNRCKAAGAMDFDDLLYYTNILLRDFPDVLEQYQDHFEYILVDEYQDTNPSQHRIVNMLANRKKKLCVVGDDAQSIYAFRGANVRNIIRMTDNYADLKLFRLEQNYRSTKAIVNAANSLIDKNTERIPKTAFSENSEGERIEVLKCETDFEEAAMIVSRIRQLRRQSGDSFNEFAVLFRTNAQSRPIEEELRRYNLPYIIYKGQSFYQRKEIKDALSYFRVVVNPDDDEALKRIINYPARGIGETTVGKLQRCAVEHNTSIWNVIMNHSDLNPGLSAGTMKKIGAFVQLMQGFIDKENEGERADNLATEILRDSGIIREFAHDNTPENVSRRENIESLLSGVHDFVEESIEEKGEESLGLSEFLQRVALSSEQDESHGDGEAIKLMTVHSAKGLEFNNVIVGGVEDDLFPSALSKEKLSEIEEERRLLYVAITRARNFCMLTYTRNRFRNGRPQMMNPSPFLRDIDSRYMKGMFGTAIPKRTPERPSISSPGSFHRPILRTPAMTVPAEDTEFAVHSPEEVAPGTVIQHSRFGQGKITELDTSGSDAKIKVEFSTGDNRTLLMKFARFKILS